MKWKRVFFLMVALVLVLAPARLLAGSRRPLEEPVTIWTATDLHYIAPDLMGDYFDEPASGGDGKAVRYSAEITGALLKQAAKEQPDVLILSGDLTLNGAEQSHRELTEQLHTLQNSGVQVLTIAGNHDVDGACADYSTFNGETLQTMPGLTSDQYKELYAPFGWQQAISRDEESLSYVYQVHPRLRILMVDTNCYGKGYVKYSTIRWIEEQLQDAMWAGAKVIGVSHQNLYAHNRMLSFGYQLYNAADLQEVYDKYRVLCNLTGHIHVQSIVKAKVPEISTSSLSVAGSHFGEVVYDGRRLTYTARETEMLRLAGQVLWYFEEVARRQTYQSFAASNLLPEQVDLLAETFANINSAYFSGQPIREEDFAEGIALWRKQDGFVSRYIDTMLESGKKDNLKIVIGG